MEILKRGLPENLVDALCRLYQEGGWWTRIVEDREAFVVPRKDCVCVYYRGNCLLSLAYHDNHFIGRVHYKYLLNPNFKPTYWNVEDGQVRRPDCADLFIPNFSDLDPVKRASRPYVGEEKYGVSEIIAANPNIIDVEVAFGDSGDWTDEDEESAPRSEGSQAPRNPRIDFVAVQESGNVPKLVFFEAKHFRNQELRAKGKGKPHVVKQIEVYEDLLKKHEKDIVDAYRRHCADMLRSACIPKDKKERRNFLSKVTESVTFELEHKPRLVVFGFDADQKPGPKWKEHKGKLEELLKGRVFTKGDAKDFVKGVRFRGRECAQ
jgi:hypothetical protein